MIKKRLIASLVFIAAFALFCGAALAAETMMDDNTRLSKHKSALEYKKSGNYKEAEKNLMELLNGTQENDLRRALYFHEYGLCFVEEGGPDSFVNAHKMFQRALDLDNNYQEVYFDAALNMFRLYEKSRKELDLGTAKTLFDNAAQRGYDVIGKITAIVDEKRNSKPSKFDALSDLLGDVNFVFTLVQAQKFKFADYISEFTDPFECPLREIVVPPPDNGSIKLPPTPDEKKPVLPYAMQEEFAKKAPDYYAKMVNAATEGNFKEAIANWRELEIILDFFDNSIWSGNHKKIVQDIKSAVSVEPLKSTVESIRGRMLIEDGTAIIMAMKTNQTNRRFEEVETKYAELQVHLDKMLKFLDDNGSSIYVKPVQQLNMHGWKIRAECQAVREFEALPLKVTGVIFRDRDSVIIINDEILEARSYADYIIEEFVKPLNEKDKSRRRLYITEIAREEVYFTYQLITQDGLDVKVNVSKKIEALGQ